LRASIEFAAAVAVVVSERFRANVHHDLIPISRRQLSGTVAQRGFRHRRQCAGSALCISLCKRILNSGRYRGNVVGLRITRLRFHRRVERLQHDSALVRRQPGANHQATLVIVVIAQLTGGVLRRGALAFFEAPDTSVGAHQFFDLRGGGVTREIEQFGFVIGIGDSGQGTPYRRLATNGGEICGLA
jgi:hypothetical protein